MRKRSVPTSAGSEGKAIHLAAVETLLLGQYPSIVAHLSVTKWDDGSPRTPGNLLLKTVGSFWSLTAKEPDDCLQLPVIGQSLDDVFTLLELFLSGDEAPWEVDTWAKQRAGRSKK